MLASGVARPRRRDQAAGGHLRQPDDNRRDQAVDELFVAEPGSVASSSSSSATGRVGGQAVGHPPHEDGQERPPEPARAGDARREGAGPGDQRATDLSQPLRDGGPSLRWLLIHLIEETGRHAGHTDILREQIDGATGR
jgi:hypothetical protein